MHLLQARLGCPAGLPISLTALLGRNSACLQWNWRGELAAAARRRRACWRRPLHWAGCHYLCSDAAADAWGILAAATSRVSGTAYPMRMPATASCSATEALRLHHQHNCDRLERAWPSTLAVRDSQVRTFNIFMTIQSCD